MSYADQVFRANCLDILQNGNIGFGYFNLCRLFLFGNTLHELGYQMVIERIITEQCYKFGRLVGVGINRKGLITNENRSSLHFINLMLCAVNENAVTNRIPIDGNSLCRGLVLKRNIQHRSVFLCFGKNVS